MDSTFPHFGTDAVHAGQSPDPATGAVIPAISLSTTFAQEAPGLHKVSDVFLLKKQLKSTG